MGKLIEDIHKIEMSARLENARHFEVQEARYVDICRLVGVDPQSEYGEFLLPCVYDDEPFDDCMKRLLDYKAHEAYRLKHGNA